MPKSFLFTQIQIRACFWSKIWQQNVHDGSLYTVLTGVQGTYFSCLHKKFLCYLHKVFHILYPLWGGHKLVEKGFCNQLPSFPTPQPPTSPGKCFHTDPRGTAVRLTKGGHHISLHMNAAPCDDVPPSCLAQDEAKEQVVY